MVGWTGVVVGGAAIVLGAVPELGMLVFPFFVLTVAALSIALGRKPPEVGAA